MIAPIADLIAVLSKEPKAYATLGIPRMTYYRARKKRISFTSACRFAEIARERIGTHIVGIQLADGSIVVAPELVRRLESLAAENAALAASVQQLQARRFRELCDAGRARIGSLTSSLD